MEMFYRRGFNAVQITELEYHYIPHNIQIENVSVCQLWETTSMTQSNTFEFPVELRNKKNLTLVDERFLYC